MKKIFISVVLLAMTFGVLGVVKKVDARTVADCEKAYGPAASTAKDACLEKATPDYTPPASANLPAVATDNSNSGAVKLENPLGTDISGIIKNFITSVLALSGVLALFAFVYGGIFWMVSMGDATKVTKGRNVMIWAVMGLIVIFGSYAIVSTIYNFLGVAK